MIRVVFSFALLCIAAADLPVDCRYSDVEGTWMFTETARTGDPSLDCTSMGEIVYRKNFTFSYPNLVTDEIGNTGTWTTISNQGFEVNINERSYWSPFYYDSVQRGFSCDHLSNGWSRDETVRNWACYTGVKVGATTSPLRHLAAPSESVLDLQYVNNARFIERLNAAQTSWRAKVYPEYEQYTNREMMRRAGVTYATLPRTAPATKQQKERAAALPTNFDWRDYEGVNYVSAVRDQASCGSCYAFAAAAQVEARLRIVTDNARQDIFSVQDVVSCTDLSEGCGGGFSYLIGGRYAKEQGFVNEECNTYTGMDDACSTDTTCGRTYVSEYEFVGGYYGACNEELMLESLVSRGPLKVSFNVESDFYNYEGGIYSHQSSIKSGFDPLTATNHAVLVVGYGVEPITEEKFWIVKNSWGAAWGEEGFFRIRRGTNEVGIESSALDVTVIP